MSTGPVCELRHTEDAAARAQGRSTDARGEHPPAPRPHAQLFGGKAHADQDRQALPGVCLCLLVYKMKRGVFTCLLLFWCCCGVAWPVIACCSVIVWCCKNPTKIAKCSSSVGVGVENEMRRFCTCLVLHMSYILPGIIGQSVQNQLRHSHSCCTVPAYSQYSKKTLYISREAETLSSCLRHTEHKHTPYTHACMHACTHTRARAPCEKVSE